MYWCRKLGVLIAKSLSLHTQLSTIFHVVILVEETGELSTNEKKIRVKMILFDITNVRPKKTHRVQISDKQNTKLMYRGYRVMVLNQTHNWIFRCMHKSMYTCTCMSHSHKHYKIISVLFYYLFIMFI